eukprot:gene7193-7764_t
MEIGETIQLQKKYFKVQKSNDPLFKIHLFFLELSEKLVNKVSQTIDEVSKNNEETKNLKLQFKPGLSYSVGSNNWQSNFLRGNIRNWAATSIIHWVSESIVFPDTAAKYIDETENSLENDSREEEDNRPNDLKLDLLILAGQKTDLPHLQLSVHYNQSSQLYELLLDYPPRQDLLTNITYFDRYYKGLNYSRQEIVGWRGHIYNRRNIPANLIRSPYCMHYGISSEGKDRLLEECVEHVDIWCSWLLNDIKEKYQRNDEGLQRDLSLQKIWFESVKITYAELLGATFAPKALDIAATVIGPVIVKT